MDYSRGSSKRSGQHMQQQTYQNQKLLQDQHYSNNITMMVLSTLESIEANISSVHLKKQQKLFSHYDKIDYQNKNFSELKCQLQSQLGAMKASRLLFSREHTGSYVMPQSFDEKRLKKQIKRFKTIFSGQDKDIYEMIGDLERISEGKVYDKMYYETHDFNVKYPKEEADRYRKDIVQRGMRAGQEMQYEKEYLQNLNKKNQKQLPTFENPNSWNSQYKR